MAAQQDQGKPPEAAAARPGLTDGLHADVIVLYRTLLEGTRAEHHRVMTPWHAFAALKPEEFTTRGKELAARFAANASEDKALNTRIAQLFAGKAPANLGDVAGRYGKLFATIARKWEKALADADRADRERPAALDGEAEEELRQLIFDPGGPLDDRTAGDVKDRLEGERRARYDELKKAVEDWRDDPSAPPLARILEDADEPPLTRVFRRGKPEDPGDEVPRRFLPVLAGPNAPPFSDGTGRYDLAKAIASKANPLTARVWVNRVWGHLLGHGLVATPGDFGTRSAPPSHPELLDWLANSLMAEGWSSKRLIRRIVLSRTYQQASADRPEMKTVDPANDLSGGRTASGWSWSRSAMPCWRLRDSLTRPRVGARSTSPRTRIPAAGPSTWP